MTTILREMIDQHTGCELAKGTEHFYVFVYGGEDVRARVIRYGDMNSHGLHQALATYELELGYLWTARLEATENDC